MSEETQVGGILRLLEEALEAMNEAVYMSATQGSPLAMEYIANWLNDRDASSDENIDRVVIALGGRSFPPDLRRTEADG